MRADVVVVGAGPAGLATAVRLAEAGREVRVVARGNGFTHWGPGAVDVLGYLRGTPVERPLEALERLGPSHPYRVVGADDLRDGLAWFQRFTQAAGLDHVGGPETNRLQVTALGTLRTTCLVPAPAAGRPSNGVPGNPLAGKVAVVGFQGFRDFVPDLCVRGLQSAGVDASAHSVELPPWDHERHFFAVDLARALDGPGFRGELAGRVARAAAGADTVVVPAVLGLASGHEAWRDFQQQVGATVVEAALPPPSIPGLRLFAAYRRRLAELDVGWQFGFPVVGVERDGDRVTAVRSEGASRPVVTTCQELVLATGGVAGRGIQANRDGTLAELVAGLPVAGFGDRMAYFGTRFLDDHPLGAAGVPVDGELRPMHPSGTPVYANVRCVGSLLAGHDPTVEGSREGVALATAARVAVLLAPAAV